MKKILFVAACALLASCGSEEAPTTPETETPTEDTTTAVVMDTTVDMTPDTVIVDSGVMTTETSGVISQEEAEAIEAAEAEATENKMDFCQCVRENKRLENLLMEEEDDAKIDELFDAMTALEGQCPELKGAVNQTSVDAKKEHERRVKKCLAGS